MLPSTLRNGCFIVLALLAVAPAASASIIPRDLGGEARDEACSHSSLADVLDEAGDSCPPAGDDSSGQEPAEGSDAADEGGSSSSGDSGSGSGSSSKPHVPVVRPVANVVKAVHDTVESLPADPVGLALSQVEPVKDTAESLPGLILPPPEGRETAPAPAAASVEEVVTPDATPLLVAAGATAAAAAVALLWLAGSSGSLGAGAAGAGTAGKLGATDLRRLLPFASPLFTRFEKDTVLGHPKREALYALILQDPGVSLQHLCDATGLSRTAVTHHLRLLELQHLIVSKRMGRNRHYYENGGRFGRDQKDAYAVLQNGRSKEVAQFVKQNPGAIQKAICAAVGVQASVAHWHLKRLQEAQLVEAVRSGRTVAYFPGPGLKALQGPPLPAAAAAPAPMPAMPMPSAPPMPAVASPAPLSA